jgi:membrane-bound metal-dependent hydrolase YbcI (DUF457 family)
MSSPLGHLIAGAAAGTALGGGPPPRLGRTLAASAVLGLAPDLDYALVLAGFDRAAVHRTFSHSLSAVLLGALLAAGVAAAWLGLGRARTALVAAAALGSHLLLDLLSPDSRPPDGLALLYPFSHHFFALPITPLPEVDPTRLAELGATRFAGLLGLEAVLVGLPALALLAWRSRRLVADHKR